VFFYDKMIAPLLLRGRGRLPPRKAKHGVGYCWRERFNMITNGPDNNCGGVVLGN
jgi:hypothetical protein